MNVDTVRFQTFTSHCTLYTLEETVGGRDVKANGHHCIRLLNLWHQLCSFPQQTGILFQTQL